MKIMSDREYERRIAEAERSGAERARRECYEEHERDSFRDAVWRELGEIRRDFGEAMNGVERKADILAGELGVEFQDKKCDGCTPVSCRPF